MAFQTFPQNFWILVFLQLGDQQWPASLIGLYTRLLCVNHPTAVWPPQSDVNRPYQTRISISDNSILQVILAFTVGEWMEFKSNSFLATTIFLRWIAFIKDFILCGNGEKDSSRLFHDDIRSLPIYILYSPQPCSQCTCSADRDAPQYTPDPRPGQTALPNLSQYIVKIIL